MRASATGHRSSSTAATAPKRLAAYRAVTEHGHARAVKAGENQGATPHHDFVERDYEQVPEWQARSGAAQTLRFQATQPAGAAHPRSIDLVVVDASTGRPVQAKKISC